MTPQTMPERAQQTPSRLPRLAPLALAILLLAGCSGQYEHYKAMGQMDEGKQLEAIEGLRRASAMEPNNQRFRIDYLTQRNGVVQGLIAAADDDRAAGRADAAMQRYREVMRLEPSNDRARVGLQALDTERRVAALMLNVERLLQANQVDAALEQLRQVLKDSPQQPRAKTLRRQLEDRVEAERLAREEQLAARAAFKRPVTLQFRDASLRMVLEALAKAGNVNLILDREVKGDQRTTVLVKDASIEDTLDVILLQNQLDKRVLNSNSLLIYPATAAKQKELAELRIRTFQLSNVDVGFMANIIKTMLKTKDIVTDVKSNTMVMRDTAEAIALAERLIAANDLPDAEVMLEVEVLEISSSRASEIGLKLPTTFSLSTPAGTTGADQTLGALRALTRNDLLATSLSATLNLMLTDTDTNILASPRIRSRNKEKAKILVGDKLPVITNIISPQVAGQNSVLAGSIQYVDVGIKLEVEPQVYADGDVGIKLNLEVSNVSDTIITEGGRAYAIGSRSAQTVLRLHDGETQILAGLISDDDRQSAAKVPGLGHLPMVGRLFGNNIGDSKKREIVLAVTPRIIRPQAQADLRFADAWSGTEGSLRDRPLRLEPLALVKATASGQAAAAPPVARPTPLPATRAGSNPTRAVAPATPISPVMPDATDAPDTTDTPIAPAAAAIGAGATPVQANTGTGMPGIPPVQARPLPGPAAPDAVKP